jgi:hypothetical protein
MAAHPGAVDVEITRRTPEVSMVTCRPTAGLHIVSIDAAERRVDRICGGDESADHHEQDAVRACGLHLQGMIGGVAGPYRASRRISRGGGSRSRG